MIALITAAGLMAVAHGPYYTFYTIYLVDHGYSKSMAGWLWALGVICEIGIFVWMPHLYRAFTLRQILLASFALAVLRFLLIAWLIDKLWRRCWWRRRCTQRPSARFMRRPSA